MSKIVVLNAVQKAILADYGDGDFAYLAEKRVINTGDIDDSLLTFLLIELSDKAGCDSLEEATNRLTTAKRDIDRCAELLVKVNLEIVDRLVMAKMAERRSLPL